MVLKSFQPPPPPEGVNPNWIAAQNASFTSRRLHHAHPLPINHCRFPMTTSGHYHPEYVMDGPLVPPPSLDFTVLPYFNPSQSTPDALILTVLHSGSVTVGESISIQRSMLSKVSKHSKPADTVPPTVDTAPGVRVCPPPNALQHKPRFLIGREVSVELEEKGKGVAIADPRASKAHAIIRYNVHTRMFEVADAGSSNGTMLNKRRLSQPKCVSPWNALFDGSTLTIGSVLCASPPLLPHTSGGA